MKRMASLIRVAIILATLVSGLTLAATPGAAQTVSATLWIYGQLSSGPFQVSVHQITSDWTEAGVTWNTRPTYDPAVAGSFVSGTGWPFSEITTP